MGVGDYHGPIKISIHVPRERDDASPFCGEGNAEVFQSTSLVRGTTSGTSSTSCDKSISIHVPRERDDPLGAVPSLDTINFNPRPS